MFLQFVLVLPSGPEQASIENVRGRSIMGNSHVDFTQIDARDFSTHRPCFCLFHTVVCYRLILSACPMDHHGLGQLPWPLQDKRIVAFAAGQSQLPLLVTPCSAVLFHTYVP